MRICFRIVAIILFETERTTASQRVPLLRRRYPATDSVSDHPFGLNIDQSPSNRGAWRELPPSTYYYNSYTALTYMVHVAPQFYMLLPPSSSSSSRHSFNTEDLVSAPNLELGWCAVILHNCASDYTNCARCLVQV